MIIFKIIKICYKMITTLPLELNEIIFKQVSFETGRSINKYYKNLTDKIELSRRTPIIFTLKKSINDINSYPRYISYITINKSSRTMREQMKHKDYFISNYTEIENNNIIIPGYYLIEHVAKLHPLSQNNNKFVSIKIKITIGYYLSKIIDQVEATIYLEEVTREQLITYCHLLCKELQINIRSYNVSKSNIEGLINLVRNKIDILYANYETN